jgi:uncharacterized protein (UPF0262 family)
VFELLPNPKFHPVNEEEEESYPEEVTRKVIEPFLHNIIQETQKQKIGWIIEWTPAHGIVRTLFVELELKPGQ